jgi:hypothetical protein
MNDDNQLFVTIRFKATIAEALSTLTKYSAGAAVVSVGLILGYEGVHCALLSITIGCAYAIINAYDTWISWN